jgi:hypothetical protein
MWLIPLFSLPNIKYFSFLWKRINIITSKLKPQVNRSGPYLLANLFGITGISLNYTKKTVVLTTCKYQQSFLSTFIVYTFIIIIIRKSYKYHVTICCDDANVSCFSDLDFHILCRTKAEIRKIIHSESNNDTQLHKYFYINIS